MAATGLEILSPENLRIDGRLPPELRNFHCTMSTFRQASGSAYVEQGNTKILAAVFGPHEATGRARQQQSDHDKVIVNCQYSMATFSTADRKLKSRGDRKSTEITSQLTQTFEAILLTSLYPHSQIDIFIEVLQSDGGEFCTSVNAATLALIDAGIPMKDFVCACTCSLTQDTTLIDLTHLEETCGLPVVSIAILPRSGSIAYLQLNSRIHEDHLKKVMDSASEGCQKVFSLMDQAVREHLSKVASLMADS